MNGTAYQAERARGLRGPGGYSLIEMIVAVAIAVVIATGLYFVFTSQQRASQSQKTYNDLQSNCSFAMDTIKADLLLAGYRARNSTQPISGATATAVTFEFWDDNASIDAPYDDVTQFTNHTQVSYSLVGTDLTKTIRRWHTPGAGAYDTPLSFVLAQDVQKLEFQYLKEDNAAWTTAESKDLIRTVRVSLQCRAARADALHFDPTSPGGTPTYQVVTLTAEVKPRNIAISENPDDKTPPDVPLTEAGATANVWDEGECGCLEMRWTSNTDSDIAGYTIYYGLVSGSYLGRSRVVHQEGADQFFQLPNLAATNAQYYIAIAAYDKSGNQSAVSAEITAPPGASVRAPGGANDTTITPLAPPAPGSPTIATPADGQLLVGWTRTFIDCMTSPVFGYRIYRSTNPSFVPNGASAGLGNCIADETTLGPTAVSYLDTGADTPQGHLVGCATYHYKIAVVHCDPARLTAYTSGTTAAPGDDSASPLDTRYTAASFASVSGAPTDGTPTSAPNLSSKAGYRRIILSVTNPSLAEGWSPDYMQTRIYFGTTAPGPTLTETRDAEGYNVILNGQLIPDGGGVVNLPGGPHTVNFDHETLETPPGGLGDPQLQADQTYYFLAVAYDRCKNHNEDAASAHSTAEQCRDCLATDVPYCRNAPPMPTNVHVTVGCNGAPLKLEWDYDPANYENHPDFQGFRAVRCEGAGCVPEDPILGGTGTVIGGTYLSPDPFLVDDSVVDGRIYNYRIYAGDCYYQRWLEGLLSGADIADNDPTDNVAANDIEGIALGYFDRAQVTATLQTYLTVDLDALATEIPVVSTAGWASRRLQINTEIIECDGVTPTSFTGCLRGAEATLAIPHFAGTPVRVYPGSPARAAVTGDLALVPPTFLHNTVLVGARNASAGTLTLNTLDLAWVDTDAFFKKLIYDDTVLAFEDTSSPLSVGAPGGSVTLSPIQVPALETDVPLNLTFLKSDGTADSTIDLRGEELELTWHYRNDATGITTCSRAWLPPGPTGIVAPPGPWIAGTTQNAPTPGTVSWPVPGLTNNPLNAIIVPSNSWTEVSTNVHDTSGTGIISVRLYYADTDPTVTTAPAVTGAYPGCEPYTMVEMDNIGGEIWSADILSEATVGNHNNRNVWFFIVAVDNEDNFDREPEAGQGAYQYFQQPEDPCLNTPRAPVVDGTADGSSVTLDWSGSWTGTPPHYLNTNGTSCTDLAGFRVFYQIGNRSSNEVSGSPFPPTTSSYTQNFTTATTNLTAGVTAAATVLPVSSTAGFLTAPGKVQIGTEIIDYAGSTATSFTGCVRGREGTTAAAHLAGDAVTQDLLALESNHYFVRAFDTCTTGAKYSDSDIFTEGTCNPSCSLGIQPPVGTSIAPGETFTITIQACGLAGNGAQDTIYVHTCSSSEGDDAPLVESPGDLGLFEVVVTTELGTGGGGGQTVLRVGANDTIHVGGFATAPNSWGNVNDCTTGGYSCGAERLITVATPPPDNCAGDHTPNTPAISTATKVGSCGTEAASPNNTKQLTLSWNKVPTPAGCTSQYYRGYLCEGAGCTPATVINGFFTSDAANCNATSCTSNVFQPGSTKLSGAVYNFKIDAVCEINNCNTAPTTRTWPSATSATVGDPCP